jgi:hypothetical protein
MELNGIEFLGTLPSKDLYKVMSKSEYWYYPSSYEETFCITALEMLAHKVLPITWEWGGLKETLHGFNAFNENDNIDWKVARSYVSSQNWGRKCSEHWLPLINKLNMDDWISSSLGSGDKFHVSFESPTPLLHRIIKKLLNFFFSSVVRSE